MRRPDKAELEFTFLLGSVAVPLVYFAFRRWSWLLAANDVAGGQPLKGRADRECSTLLVIGVPP